MSLFAQVGKLIMGSADALPAKKIFHMRQASLPQFRWEWHPKKQIVYLIDIAMGERLGRAEGNAIAFNIDTEGGAWNAVLIWCRGYKAGRFAQSHNDSGKIVLLGDHQ